MKHPITKMDRNHNGDTLQVIEIFRSLQGEGIHTGWPAIFIRLAGCNLRCHFCDTDFETNRREETYLDLVDQVMRLAGRDVGLIVITGGEPMLQNFTRLAGRLVDAGMRVEIETAGTVFGPWMLDFLSIYGHWFDVTCSPKTRRVNKQLRPWITAWKYIHNGVSVIGQQHSGVFNVAWPINSTPVYYQPMDDGGVNPNIPRLVAQACIKEGKRLSLQVHKLVGVE